MYSLCGMSIFPEHECKYRFPYSDKVYVHAANNIIFLKIKIPPTLYFEKNEVNFSLYCLSIKDPLRPTGLLPPSR